MISKTNRRFTTFCRKSFMIRGAISNLNKICFWSLSKLKKSIWGLLLPLASRYMEKSPVGGILDSLVMWVAELDFVALMKSVVLPPSILSIHSILHKGRKSPPAFLVLLIVVSVSYILSCLVWL